MQNREKTAEFTSAIVAAYVSNNEVPQSELPKLIHEVYAALASAIDEKPSVAVSTSPPRSAVSVKKSIFPDYLICLEDGKRFKSLKRHLRSAYDLTPERYREKWRLPADYPMVAPNYAAARSKLAKSSGLGNKAPKKK